MRHVTRRVLAALFLSPLLAVPAVLSAQGVKGALTVSGGGTDPVLWFEADEGSEVGLGNIAFRWQEARGGTHAVTQNSGSRMPLLQYHALNGRAALHFDGNDMLSRTDGMPTGDYTKVAVVVLDDYGSNNNVLSGASQHALFYGGTPYAQMYHSGTFVTSSVPTPLGKPTVLVATYDAVSGVEKLYQDGKLVGTGTAPPNTDPTIQVGAFAGDGFLRGSIPELRVYDRVLSANERRWIAAILTNRYCLNYAPRVSFSRLPQHGQVFQRNGSNTATLWIEGEVESPGYDEIEIEIFQDATSWVVENHFLAYAGSTAPFSFSPTIAAGLYDYELVVRAVRGTVRAEVARVERFVCGDTLLVNGQSNAMAGDYGAEALANLQQSPWIRSFGSGIATTTVEYDLHWDTADGELFNDHATIGAWALRMAAVLLAQEQVPIGLINGGIGGTTIANHLRNDAHPADPTTIYGRLLYRAELAGMDQTARALIWYQGESDGDNVTAYAADFAELYDDWHLDYPALEKIYLFQLRKGCFMSAAGVREFQRTAPDIYPDIEVMSTTAATTHDGCHFMYAGYAELGNRMARLLARDLHGSTDTQEIDPPNIYDAEFVGAGNDQILLTFRDPNDVLVFESGAEAHFYLDNTTTVVSGTVAANTILLQLSGSSTTSTISYDGHSLDGPWVRNARGVGALTFFDFPVAP